MAKKYETIFRGKFLFMDCHTFDDLIRRAEQQVEEWKRMKADKLRVVTNSCDDYFFIRTGRAEIAAKYKLEEVVD